MPRSLSDQFSYSLAIFDWSPQKTLMLNVQPSNLSICAPAKIAWGWICWTVKTFCCVVKEELTWFSSDWADVPGLRFRVTDISLCRFRDAEWYIAIEAFQIFVTAFSYATKFGWTSASRSRPTLVSLTERLETFFLYVSSSLAAANASLYSARTQCHFFYERRSGP